MDIFYIGYVGLSGCWTIFLNAGAIEYINWRKVENYIVISLNSEQFLNLYFGFIFQII
jgi:hypothetical protein